MSHPPIDPARAWPGFRPGCRGGPIAYVRAGDVPRTGPRASIAAQGPATGAGSPKQVRHAQGGIRSARQRDRDDARERRAIREGALVVPRRWDTEAGDAAVFTLVGFLDARARTSRWIRQTLLKSLKLTCAWSSFVTRIPSLRGSRRRPSSWGASCGGQCSRHAPRHRT
jgi:hypothetical protein